MPSLVIARNQSSGQNLVESTKLKRFPNDPKTALLKEEERKVRRKHKKEKREKSHKHSSNKADKKQLLPSKKTSDESDQLEKSDLTGELEGPQNQLGYLSDGSQTSKKRKRDASPPAVESLIKAAPVAGKPIRIRLIFKKPKVESPSLPRDDILACSGAKSLNHREKTEQAVVTSSVPKICDPDLQAVITSSVPCSEVCEPELQAAVTSSVPCSKVCVPEFIVPLTSVAAIDETKKRKKHKLSREDRYNALFDDWTPPSSICFPVMDVDPSSKDDDDWLFGNRTQDKLKGKAAVKIDEDVSMSLQRSSDSSWPKPQFMSEVGIYSLPYTVPF